MARSDGHSSRGAGGCQRPPGGPGTMATVHVTYWRDIPVLVTARDEREEVSVPLGPAFAAGTSLRFHGSGTGGIDRVAIPLAGPARPVDVGATDFTLEWWMKTDPAENATGVATCDERDGWMTGRVVFDRDVYGAGDFGDYGVALTPPPAGPDAPATARRVAFGASQGGAGTTLCGAADVAD